MKKKRLLMTMFAAATLFLLVGCRTDREQLTEINRLLNDNKLDSAQMCLNSITLSDLSEKDKPLYLLATIKLNHLQYRPIASDTIIRYCIDEFTRTGDKERLAESLYYQAVTYYEDGHVAKAFEEMKKAENEAHGISDLTVRHKIIECLTDWNMSEHQYQLAMEYGRQNLVLSSMAGNNNWIAYALVFISQIHAGMGQRDSASHYLDKCISYISEVPDSQRVDFYNYIAALTMKDDLPTAQSYAMKSNAIRPNSVGYITLAQIRHREGNQAAADSLCTNAYYLAKTPEERIYVLQTTMKLFELQNRHDRAYLTSKMLIKAKENEARLREEHDVRNVQSSFDNKIRDMRFRQTLFYAFLLAVLLALIFLARSIQHRLRLNKKSSQIMQNQLLINHYEEKIHELEQSDKDKSEELEVLIKDLAEVKERQTLQLAKGKQYYDHIVNGGTAYQWNKPEYIDFIEYYKVLDIAFVSKLEKEYKNLSERQKLYLILFEMGKEKMEVQRVLGVADGTMRSIKSRVKGSKKRT